MYGGTRKSYSGWWRPRGRRGSETVAFTAPILDSAETFSGCHRPGGRPVLEDVTSRTVRSLEERQEFRRPVYYQMVNQEGDVFADSDLLERAPKCEAVGTSLRHSQSVGGAGIVEEDIEALRRHRVCYQWIGESPGLGWYVLMRMDRDRIVDPIRSILWKVGLAGAIVWLPMLVFLFWSTSKLRTEYQQAQQESAWARAAEAALLQSQERNRAIVDNALDGLITIDSGGVVTDWNGQAAAIFGWPREEVLGRRLSELIIPSRDREAHERGLRHFLATGEAHILNRRIEVLALHRSGREFPVELAIFCRSGLATRFSSAHSPGTSRRREAETKLGSEDVSICDQRLGRRAS